MTAKRKKKKVTPPVEAPGGIPLGGILLLMGAGLLLVLGARAGEGRVVHLLDLLPYGLWLVSTVWLVLFLRIGGYRGTPALPGTVLLLSAVGVLVRSRMEGSVEGLTGWTHLVQPLGFVWMWAAWVLSRRGRLKWMRPFWFPAFVLSVGIVAGVIVLGNQFRGAMYGPGGMTPTELLKILLPVSLAGFFCRRESVWEGCPCWNPPLGELIMLGFGWAVLCGLLAVQRDMGLIVLVSVMLTVLLVSVTRSGSWLVLFAATLAGGGWLILNHVAHGARRFHSWLDPFADPTGAGWQVLQGLTGLYAGGLIGTGFGGGRPERVPIAGSDFVYAVYGEEMGFLGCVLLLALFAGLLRAAARVANQQDGNFAGCVAVGVTALLTVQIVVNIAGVVTLLPVTGITLPYISQGGSSYWVTSIQFGLLLGLADRADNVKKSGRRR